MDEFKENDKQYPIEVCNILDDFFDWWLTILPNKLLPIHDIKLTTILLITNNYFENYQFISQHWKLFLSLVFVLRELE